MCADTHNFDVIGITELFSLTSGECSFPGYLPIECNVRSDNNNSRGGVGIYIKDCYDYKLRTDIFIFILVRGLNQIIVQIVPQAPFLDQGEI